MRTVTTVLGKDGLELYACNILPEVRSGGLGAVCSSQMVVV